MSNNPKEFQDWMKLVATVGAVGSFIWGVYVWDNNNVKDRESAELEARQITETRSIEAKRPFLEKQLSTYVEAVRVTATIAASGNHAPGSAGDKLKDDLKRQFWILYNGELAIVENRQVEAIMVEYGTALKNGDNDTKLGQISLKLTKEIRSSLDASWGINAWSKGS